MSVLTEIEEYLDKVCKDKELKLYALSYCIDILNVNKDKTFTKEDFETLTIDNEEVEQDIVKTLFKDKTIVSFEEVFVETLKQNLQSIDFMPEKDNLTCALYNTHYKTITVIDKEKWYLESEKKKERIKILKNSLKNNQPLKF